MTFFKRFTTIYKALLPSPFSIAIVLSLFTIILALSFGEFNANSTSHFLDALGFWADGLWNSSLLAFTVQMMLMLLFGHIIALSPSVNQLITRIVVHLNSTAKAAYWVTLCTMLVGLFNWGLGLIFGAIFAQKVAQYAKKNNLSVNYPIIGAAGYSALLIWHGGLSGSALAKIAETGHLSSLLQNSELSLNPITYEFTVFSPLNLTTNLVLLLFVPWAMYMLGKKVSATPIHLKEIPIENSTHVAHGAERLDSSSIFGRTLGALWVSYALYLLFVVYNGLAFFTPNNINFLLFGLALISHKNLNQFTIAATQAIQGTTGILIQFPLYFGIMGIIKNVGLIPLFATSVSAFTNATTLPFFTFFSAGLVNMLVPSGGGQWAIQGPILIETCVELGANIPKNILAFAYGDQITNMLQPFWALPLLGITQLKAKDILPYTLFLFAVSLPVFLLMLWWF